MSAINVKPQASGIVTKAELTKLLECSVCWETYSEVKLPKVLPCQHTVCVSCLKVIAGQKRNKSVTCVICRTKHLVPGRLVDNFPNNFTAIDVIGILSTNNQHRHSPSTVRKRDKDKVLNSKQLKVNISRNDNYEMMTSHQVNAMKTAADAKYKETSHEETHPKSFTRSAPADDNSKKSKCRESVDKMDCIEVYSKKGVCLRNIRNLETGSQWRPRGVAQCHLSGDNVVTERDNIIHVFDSEWHHLHSFGERGTSPGQFRCPSGVRINRNGHLVVCDYDNARIQILHKTGEVQDVITWPGVMRNPHDVALDEDGNMFVTDAISHCVLVFDSSGRPKGRFGSKGSQLGKLNEPSYIAVVGNRVIVSEYWNYRVQVLDKKGRSIGILGQMRKADGECEILLKPRSVQVDSDDNILVVDAGDNTIKVFCSQTGEYVTKFAMQHFSCTQTSFMGCSPDGTVMVTNSGVRSLTIY